MKITGHLPVSDRRLGKERGMPEDPASLLSLLLEPWSKASEAIAAYSSSSSISITSLSYCLSRSSWDFLTSSSLHGSWTRHSATRTSCLPDRQRFLGVDGDNDVGTLFVHRHVKARVGRIRSVGTTGLHNPLFHLLAQIRQEGKRWDMLVRFHP
jgi:hypothetical protein